MNEYINFITTFGDLNSQDLAVIQSVLVEKKINKGEYFSEAGQVPKEIGFILKGVIRGVFMNERGEDISRCFITEYNLVCDYVNMESGKRSTESLQASEDCLLLVMKKDDWVSLSEKIPQWEIIKTKMVRDCLYLKSRTTPVISDNASVRYLRFLVDHPNLVNRIPLAHIASFLGVTQQSLSRIRRNI